MMNAIRKKLNSSDGASILMALLLLLVGVMVSTVVLTAATSAAKTIRTDREQQQTYLTVSSAATLVRDSILNGSGGYKTETKEIYSDSRYKTLYEGPTETVTEADGNFSSILNDGIAKVMKTPSLTYTRKCTIQDEAEQYEKVTADFELSAQTSAIDGNTSYILKVTFNAGSGDHLCKMTLKMEGVESIKTTESTLSGYISSSWGMYTWKSDAYQRITTTSIDWSQTTPVISRERVTAG